MATPDLTATETARRRRARYADALLMQGSSSEPVQHWAQGLARLGQGVIGGVLSNQIETDEKDERDRRTKALLGLLGGDEAKPAAATAPVEPVKSTELPEQPMLGATVTNASKGLFNPMLGQTITDAARGVVKPTLGTQVTDAYDTAVNRPMLGDRVSQAAGVQGPKFEFLSPDAKNEMYGPQWGLRQNLPASGESVNDLRRNQPGDGRSAYDSRVNLGADPVQRLADVIAKHESGGKYDITGPVVKYPSGKTDRPYGKYQVMGANIPQWTREVLGREMTPDEFLRNPQAQDAVAKAKIGQFYQQHGNPEDVLAIWASGRPLAQSASNKDLVFGTTVKDIVAKRMADLTGNAARGDAARNVAPAASATPPSNPSRETAPPAGATALGSRSELLGKVRMLVASGDPQLQQFGLQLFAQMNKPSEYKFMKLDDGSIVRMDERSGRVDPVFQGPKNAKFGVIGENEGNKRYGFIDESKGTVTPYGAPGSDDRPKPPSGFQWSKTQPGKLEAIPGGPATHLTGEVAGRISLAQQAIQSFKEVRSIFERQLNPSEYGQAQLGMGDIGRAQRSVTTAIEAVLRMMTGAAAPRDEVARYENLFMPKTTDSVATRKQKLDNLEGFFNRAITLTTQGRGELPPMPGSPSGGSPPKSDPLGIR